MLSFFSLPQKQQVFSLFLPVQCSKPYMKHLVLSSLQNHSTRCLYFLSLPPNRFDIVDKSNAKPNKKRISFQFQDAISFVIDDEGTSCGKHSRVSYNLTIRIVENSRFQRDSSRYIGSLHQQNEILCSALNSYLFHGTEERNSLRMPLLFFIDLTPCYLFRCISKNKCHVIFHAKVPSSFVQH